MIVIIVSFFGSPPIEEGFETRHKKKKKCRPKKPTHLPTPNPTEAPTNPPTVSPTEPPTEKPKCTKSPRRTIVIEKEIKKSCPKKCRGPKCRKYIPSDEEDHQPDCEPIYLSPEPSDTKPVPKDKNCDRSICEKCECPNYPDMSKYVLKSKIPPEPDMSKYILKSQVPNRPDPAKYVPVEHMPDMTKYILKTEVERMIQSCRPANIDMSKYVLKSKIKECPPPIDESRYILKSKLRNCDKCAPPELITRYQKTHIHPESQVPHPEHPPSSEEQIPNTENGASDSKHHSDEHKSKDPSQRKPTDEHQSHSHPHPHQRKTVSPQKPAPTPASAPTQESTTSPTQTQNPSPRPTSTHPPTQSPSAAQSQSPTQATTQRPGYVSKAPVATTRPEPGTAFGPYGLLEDIPFSGQKPAVSTPPPSEASAQIYNSLLNSMKDSIHGESWCQQNTKNSCNLIPVDPREQGGPPGFLDSHFDFH